MSALDLFEQPLANVIAEYNRLLALKGQPPITKWDKSKLKLVDAIARLDPVEDTPSRDEPRRVSSRGEPRKPKETDGITFTLADLARELIPGDNGPKILRAKARRHTERLQALIVPDTIGWIFLTSHKGEVMDILKLKKKG